MKYGFQKDALARLKKQFMRSHELYEKGFEEGMEKAGLRLQALSQEQVPVDTGALRASADTRKKGSGLKTEVRVVYTEEYAVYVHENLDAHHTEGKAKYLEDPMKENRKELSKIIHAWVDYYTNS